MGLSRRIHSLSFIVCLFSALPLVALAAPSLVERLSEQVCVVRDDAGNWGGGVMGITHQCHPDYWAKKRLDLSNVPAGFWSSTTRARLSVYFCVRDYSWRAAKRRNGLDEAFEVVVNGNVHRYATNSGVPVFLEGKPMDQSMRWHDFALPLAELVRGPNEIIFRKVHTGDKKPDDYFYLGIDNTVEGGNSWVRFGKGAKWRQDKLTIPGGKGEYMVRLYLIRGATSFQASWLALDGRFDDPLKMFEYAGSDGPTTRVEWNPLRLDPLSPVSVVIETAGAKGFDFQWLDEKGKPVKPPVKARGPRHVAELRPPLRFRPSGVQLDKSLPVKSVTLLAWQNYHPLPRRIDMAPHIAPPKGSRGRRRPSCRIEQDQVRFVNDTMLLTVKTSGRRLRLTSLHSLLAATEVVRRPQDCALFLVEVDGKRYAGTRDFTCENISPRPWGFTATLSHPATGLEAVLDTWIGSDLRMTLKLTNRSPKPLHFKVAFPHLSGLAISDEPADDYYFFPWGGGIISDAPALIRRGYGDHAAIYQVMDIFSPERGAGLAIRCLDTEGRYKVLALRKHIPGRPELNGDRADTPTAEEFKWTNSLPQVPGIGVSFEYLRRTRKPGGSFQTKAVALEAHAGDWRVAMKAYADWCHRVWKFRPHPSRLTPVVNMIACGWGKSPLFRDGKYRTDFIRPRCDCIELMSWWEWSPLGPWRTPWEELKEKLGEAKYRRYSPYFVKDPVTGKTMYPINRGDYDGYNRRWGGLPAFRQAIKTYRKMGALVTLYTDPILACDNSRCGQRRGKLWGIVQPDGSYRTNYESWNMCHDVAEYRQFVADTMRRVMRETDADGIRLDEYGHKGAACFSKLHKHTFAEHGCTEWQRAIAEATKMVRQAMDEVKPGSVLTTEHPGYDYLMQFIEGCITYDLTVQATPLRPLEVNLQRFYFPECKAFELDHRGADRQHRKRFWNAVGSFGSYYPPNFYNILRENADAFEGRDCQPLVPTLARHVYANRFGGKQKTVYTLYNATGHTFAGPVLRLAVGRGEHVFDLLSCREADCEAGKDGAEVRVFLSRDHVACLARLPARLAVGRAGDSLKTSVHGDTSGLRVSVCDRNGEPLLSQPARGDENVFDLGSLTRDGPSPACVKLLDATRLVDIAAVPPAE